MWPGYVHIQSMPTCAFKKLNLAALAAGLNQTLCGTCTRKAFLVYYVCPMQGRSQDFFDGGAYMVWRAKRVNFWATPTSGTYVHKFINYFYNVFTLLSKIMEFVYISSQNPTSN